MSPKRKAKAKIDHAKPVGDEVFDDFDALVQLAQDSFASVAKKVAADNAARGLPIYGAENGKLVTRQPTGKRGRSTPRDPG